MNFRERVMFEEREKCPLTNAEIKEIYVALKPSDGSISCQDDMSVHLERPDPSNKGVNKSIENGCHLVSSISATMNEKPCCCYPRITSTHQYTGNLQHAEKTGVFLSPPILKVQRSS